MHPLALIVAFVVLVLAAVIWKIRDADECIDGGAVVVAPMMAGQHCVVE